MTFYLIDDLEQGTQQWRNWRKGVVGASDAPTIMGENPWASRSRLLEEKLGLHKEFEGNAATREGHQLEGPARKVLENHFKQKLNPKVVQDAKEPFLAASLDAIDDSQKNIYEIKCGAKTYEQTLRSNAVPKYYRAQLQHVMMITELEKIIFAAYRPGKETIILKVMRDERYIKQLRSAEIEFVSELKSRGHELQYEFRGVRVH
jgi:putative phage-type endonuclease